MQLECDRLIKEIQVLKRTTMRKYANLLYLDLFFENLVLKYIECAKKLLDHLLIEFYD